MDRSSTILAGERKLDWLMSMMHSPVRNYVVPGVTSWLVGERSAHGCLRLLHSSRCQVENVVPHSHRFDFRAEVLQGLVRNVLWMPADEGFGDLYEMSHLIYGQQPGKYTMELVGSGLWWAQETLYRSGESYGMQADEIHSIFFGRDTWVLFYEGATKSDRSCVLQPVVDGETIPTFKVEPWMFRKEA